MFYGSRNYAIAMSSSVFECFEILLLQVLNLTIVRM